RCTNATEGIPGADGSQNGAGTEPQNADNCCGCRNGVDQDRDQGGCEDHYDQRGQRDPPRPRIEPALVVHAPILRLGAYADELTAPLAERRDTSEQRRPAAAPRFLRAS